MAISIVQSAFNPQSFFTVTSGTATATLGAAVTSGNAVLLAFAGSDSQSAKTIGTVTDNKSNTGYSTLTYNNTTVTGQGWFLLVNITNGPTVFDIPFTTVSSTSRIIMGVYELAGLSSTPSDYANLQTSGFTTTFNLTFNTTAINEMGFAILSNANGSGQTAMTLTNGWTADYTNLTGSTFFSEIAHMALPSSGSNAIAGSTTAADEWNVSIVSLEPGSGVIPPPTTPARGPMPKCVYILP
jgi:hypothetical protein